MGQCVMRGPAFTVILVTPCSECVVVGIKATAFVQGEHPIILLPKQSCDFYVNIEVL